MSETVEPIFVDSDPALSREAARASALAALLVRVVPLLESLARIDPAHGGPDPDELEMGDDGSWSLPELLEAQRLLSAELEDDDLALALGPINDLDSPDPELTEATPQLTGDALLDAAAGLLRATEALRAHRIAGMDAETAERTAGQARGLLVHAAQEDGTPPLSPDALAAALAAEEDTDASPDADPDDDAEADNAVPAEAALDVDGAQADRAADPTKRDVDAGDVEAGDFDTGDFDTGDFDADDFDADDFDPDKLDRDGSGSTAFDDEPISG